MNRPSAIDSFSSQVQRHLGTPQSLAVLRNLLVLTMLLWACFTLARLFWLMVPEPDLPEVASTSPRNALVRNTPTSVGDVDLEPLLATELFGPLDATAPEPEVAQPVAVETAAETKLNLTLKGVIKSSIAENSQAIIAHGREEKVYHVGDSLPGGARVLLYQVDSDRVILDNAGRKEALNLFDKNAVSSASSAPEPAGRAGPVVDFSNEPVTAGLNDDSDNEEEAPEQRVISSVPKSLAEVIKFSVAREDGEIIGYKIRPGRDRDTFSSLGLETNDIVTDINGIALTSSGSVTQVYREMRTATSATVTLLRDGQSMQINVSLDTDQ
ncbi:type II secretion system protein GspC [Halioxenophilus sp. WMMB6]|uniref:type II secretion system protein GspC n=1 Tax=Halioxenophilus sp. WMMB6 TaxID=3073815 RepID=UPI00295EA6C7|nr:type II secretion system protein GspC [Halioxenophilus sp. WMMB6]